MNLNGWVFGNQNVAMERRNGKASFSIEARRELSRERYSLFFPLRRNIF